MFLKAVSLPVLRRIKALSKPDLKKGYQNLLSSSRIHENFRSVDLTSMNPFQHSTLLLRGNSRLFDDSLPRNMTLLNLRDVLQQVDMIHCLM